jgi:hypothetical protein
MRCSRPASARSALDKESTGETAIQLLLKPFGVDELARKMREILGSRVVPLVRLERTLRLGTRF